MIVLIGCIRGTCTKRIQRSIPRELIELCKVGLGLDLLKLGEGEYQPT